MEIKKAIEAILGYLNALNRKIQERENESIAQMARDFSLTEQKMAEIYQSVVSDIAESLKEIIIGFGEGVKTVEEKHDG